MCTAGPDRFFQNKTASLNCSQRTFCGGSSSSSSSNSFGSNNYSSGSSSYGHQIQVLPRPPQNLAPLRVCVLPPGRSNAHSWHSTPTSWRFVRFSKQGCPTQRRIPRRDSRNCWLCSYPPGFSTKNLTCFVWSKLQYPVVLDA